MGSPSPTETIMSGTRAFAPKNVARRRLPRKGPVDAQQHGGAGDAVLVQQVDDRHMSRVAPDAQPATDIDGDLRGLGPLDHVSGRHPRPLEGHQAIAAERDDLRQDGLDPLPPVDRDGHER